MSIATKLGLAYSAYYRDPYSSRRQVILPDAPYRTSFPREQGNYFLSRVIGSLPPCDAGCMVSNSLPESNGAPNEKIGVVPSSSTHSPKHIHLFPLENPQMMSSAKSSGIDAAVQVNSIEHREPCSHSGNEMVSSKPAEPAEMPVQDDDVNGKLRLELLSPHISPSTGVVSSEKQLSLASEKQEFSTATNKVAESTPDAEQLEASAPLTHEPEESSAGTQHGKNGKSTNIEEKDVLLESARKTGIDVGTEMDGAKEPLQLPLPMPSCDATSEEDEKSLEDSLKRMILAGRMSEVVDCIFHKLQAQNGHAVGRNDSIQQLTTYTLPPDRKNEAAKLIEIKEKVGEPSTMPSELDENARRELAIHLYTLRNQVQELATELDARESLFQRQIRSYSAKTNESRKITVEIVKDYEVDPVAYKKPPFRLANIKDQKETKKGSDQDYYEDDFTFDKEEGSDGSWRESSKKSTPPSSSSSLSSSVFLINTKNSTVKQKVKKPLIPRSSPSSTRSSSFISTDSSIARTVTSTAFTSSSRRSDNTRTISTPVTSGSFRSSSSRKVQRNRNIKTVAKRRDSPVQKKNIRVSNAPSGSQSEVSKNKGRKKSRVSDDSSSRSSFFSSSSASSSSRVAKMNETAIKAFWARHGNRNDNERRDSSLSSISTSSSAS